MRRIAESSLRREIIEVGLLGALILVSLVGCAGRKPVPPPQMQLNIHSDPASNKGQVFYLVTRSVTDRQFLSDTYQSVASLVFAEPPDPSVLAHHAIVPGNRQALKVPQPMQNAVAFYFLFTEPGDNWKKMVSQPLASSYDIKITPEDDVLIDRHKGFFRRLWPF